MIPESMLWFILSGLLVILMFLYELLKFGLMTEIIENKKYTSHNIGTLIFGCSIATGCFVLAIKTANTILVRMSMW